MGTGFYRKTESLERASSHRNRVGQNKVKLYVKYNIIYIIHEFRSNLDSDFSLFLGFGPDLIIRGVFTPDLVRLF